MSGSRGEAGPNTPRPSDRPRPGKPDAFPEGATAGLADATGRMFAALINVDVVGAEGLHVRHAGGQHGRIAAADILAGRMRVIDPRTRETSEYDSVAELARDGWSVAEAAP